MAIEPDCVRTLLLLANGNDTGLSSLNLGSLVLPEDGSQFVRSSELFTSKYAQVLIYVCASKVLAVA